MSRDVVAVATLVGTLVMLRLMSNTVLQEAGNLFEICFFYIRNSYPGMLPDIS